MRLLLLIFSCFSLSFSYLDNYYCGAGTVSKTLSYLASSACGREPINGCCYQHDSCYEWNMLTPYIVGCDQQFANCSYTAYATKNQTWCASIIYYTHGAVVNTFGAAFRNAIGYGFG
uniref:Uncharacterized protein n=1 Tax=Panagrolaimus sp. ES5 TaxID=591445 RepID=A0AC34FHZ7_9BILA